MTAALQGWPRSWVGPLSIILTLLTACSVNAEDHAVELYLFGASRHSNRDVAWRERNPGIGLGYVYANDARGDLLVAVGTYRDSFNAQARFALAGFRAITGIRDGLHASFDGVGGYFEGSGFAGVGIVPVLSVGYGPVDICAAVTVAKDHTASDRDPKASSTSSIAIFGRLTVWRF